MLFRAFFERGEDISNIDVLSRLASDVGLDSSALRQALDKHEYLESVLADEQGGKKTGESVQCPLSS